MALPARVDPYLEEGEVKPRLRGVSHALAFVASLVGCFYLALAPVEGARYVSSLVFGVTLVLLFGTSATYHCPVWSPAISERLRRCDHAAIYVVIAGSFTPLAALDAAGWGPLLLWVMWPAALTGAGLALVGYSGPRHLRSVLYVLLGAIAVPVALGLPAVIGPARVGWLFLEGFLYTLGAVIYVRRWPNPHPPIFGFHEIFHLLVVASAAIHYAVLISVLYAR
ncbi:MAG: hemolysin III family protein [Cystobacter sp.]